MGKETAATKETAAKLQPTESESQPAARRRWNNIIPALTWLRAYQPQWLRADLIAGITLAAYLMPAGLADASLANLPPEAGLYACLFSGLVFWLFCSSRHTAVTVTSAISVLVGASLGDLAGGDASRFWALASCTALIVGALAFIAWLAKAGVIVNFISESVLVGFKCGIALFIASTQLPKLFGFKGSHGDFWERSGYFFSHLRETNTASLLLGVSALILLLLGKRFLKNKPVALFVVIAGILFASTMDLGSLGVKVLGDVPQGLPPFGLPSRHCRRKRYGRLGPRFSRQRRNVPVARERKRRRAHAFIGIRRCPTDAADCFIPISRAPQSAAARARGYRAHGGNRSLQAVGT